MPARPKQTIASQLSAARIAISNTLSDPEIQQLVAQYGYGTQRMQEGKTLYDSALATVNAHTAADGTQHQATLQARAAEQQARASYQALAQVARAVFMRNTSQRTALGLVGTAPQSTPAFLAAANTLFENALRIREITTTLAAYGYDDGRLTRERAAIAAFDTANQAQVAAIGAAQQATRAQQAALIALNQWVAQYLKIARVALRDKPQLVEKLGGAARTAKTAAQREAPRKAAATRAARRSSQPTERTVEQPA